MTRNSAKSTNGSEPIQSTPIKRTRTHMNTLIVYKHLLSSEQAYFVAVHNGEVVAAFAYDEGGNLLVTIQDTMGAYSGMKTYVRAMRSELVPVLVTKSVDADVVSAQADKFVIERFLENYLDRITVRKLHALEESTTAEFEAQPTQ